MAFGIDARELARQTYDWAAGRGESIKEAIRGCPALIGADPAVRAAVGRLLQTGKWRSPDEQRIARPTMSIDISMERVAEHMEHPHVIHTQLPPESDD